MELTSGAELHGNVDVLGGGFTSLDQTDSLEHVWDEQAVDNEAVSSNVENGCQSSITV